MATHSPYKFKRKQGKVLRRIDKKEKGRRKKRRREERNRGERKRKK